MSIKLPKIQNTDDFQSYIDKVNAIIDAISNGDYNGDYEGDYEGDLNELIGDRDMIYFDTSLNMISNQQLAVGDICMTLGTAELGDDCARIFKVVASTLGFDTDSCIHYELDNGLWAYNCLSFSGGNSNTGISTVFVPEIEQETGTLAWSVKTFESPDEIEEPEPCCIKGKSAYEIAVDKGYQGTEEEWVALMIALKTEPCRFIFREEGIYTIPAETEASVG